MVTLAPVRLTQVSNKTLISQLEHSVILELNGLGVFHFNCYYYIIITTTKIDTIIIIFVAEVHMIPRNCKIAGILFWIG